MKRKILLAGTTLLLASVASLHAAEALIVENTAGPVSDAEIRAFKKFMHDAPVPTNNLHNAMVYGSGGTAVEAMGRMVEIAGDQEFLDR